MDEPNVAFYEANGRFRLLAPVSGRKEYSLRCLGEAEKGSSFRFEVQPGKSVRYVYREKYGDIIAVPITLGECVVLQIEPREILF